MAKFVFVFVLAFFALQGSDAHLLREDAAGNNVQDLVSELKKLIHETASRFAGVYTELKDKIVEIDDEANIAGLFADFKQQVEQMWPQGGVAACETVAQQEISEVVRLAVVVSCKLEINEETTALKKQLEVLTSKVGNLLKEIGRDVYNCLRESQGSHDKFTQCMDEKVYIVKQSLQVVEKEIDEFFNVIEKSIPVFTDKFSTCAADHKDKLVDRMEVAVDTLKKCLDDNNVASVSFKKSGFVNVVDYVKYLADEINQSTADVTIQLPAGIISLADKINEIVAAHNLEAVVVEAKATVNQVLSEHENDEKLCGPAAHQQLDSLAQDSQAEGEDCVSHTQQVVDALEVKLSALAEKSRALGELLNEKMLACAQEHLMNVVQFARCMERSTEELRDQLEQLQQEVRETLQYAAETVQTALKDLDVCLVKVEDKTVTQGKLALDTLNSCINHAELLF